ncbi:hypothetical protein DY000_02016863 [Brassica cretica]|uniref:Uncharacterized protein n=1 Tax=Brassica cretica TaxID=69181 RepID=A0ABQ7D5Q4_BRACR|nr:hypothetical protein DY000_02016863 [Brassica cretica]
MKVCRQMATSCQHLGLGDVSCEGLFPSFLEYPIDLGCGASSVMNLRFYHFYFRGRFRDVIADVANLRFVTSGFPTLSAFAASDPSLLFGQFLMFYPEDVFFFLCHGLVKQGIFLSRAAPWVVSSRTYPDGSPCAFSVLSNRVAKSSLFPRNLVVPRGRTARVLAVRVSTCLARDPMSFSYSSDFFSKVEIIFLYSSNAAVLASALTAETFLAGVLTSSPLLRVCPLFRSSVVMSD